MAQGAASWNVIAPPQPPLKPPSNPKPPPLQTHRNIVDNTDGEPGGLRV